jgi:hypothetical protein
MFHSNSDIRLPRQLYFCLLLVLLVPLDGHAGRDPFVQFVGGHLVELLAIGDGPLRLAVDDNRDMLIYQDDASGYQPIDCHSLASFGLHAVTRSEGQLHAEKLGALQVGRCSKDQLGDRDAAGIQATLDRFAQQLSTSGGVSVSELEVTQTQLQDGSRVLKYPLLLIGHGVVIRSTVIAFPVDGGDALVLQYQLQDACDRLADSLLCSDPEQVVEQLAELLLGAPSR